MNIKGIELFRCSYFARIWGKHKPCYIPIVFIYMIYNSKSRLVILWPLGQVILWTDSRIESHSTIVLWTVSILLKLIQSLVLYRAHFGRGCKYVLFLEAFLLQSTLVNDTIILFTRYCGDGQFQSHVNKSATEGRGHNVKLVDFNNDLNV